jgi:DNA-binding beta-propeller fold protein YncE
VTAVAALCALTAAPALGDPVPLLQFGSPGTGAGELNTPGDAALDGAGNVYVGSLNNHRVDVFDSAGGFIHAFGRGVATGGPGFEVCTTASGCQVGGNTGAGGDLLFPGGLLIDGAGRLYVSDNAVANRISVFDISSGTPVFLEVFGWGVATGAAQFEVCTIASSCQDDVAGGGEAGRFNYPRGMALDGSGNLYVADDRNNRIEVINVAGPAPVFLGAFGWDVVPGGTPGFEICTVATTCQPGQIASTGNPGQVRQPFGVALDGAGRLYVADSKEDRIVVFDVSGTPAPLAAFGWGVATGAPGFEVCTTSCQLGTIGGGAGQFHEPTDVGLDAAGRLSVTDSLNNRISVFDVSGTPAFVHSFGWDVIPGGATGFEVCTTATGCKTAAFGSGLGQFNVPGSLAVDCRGAVWVPNDNRVQRFGEPGTASPPCSSPAGAAGADTTPPNTKIGKHPQKKTRKRRAKFTFSSNEPGSSFKCKLDRKPFKPCRTPLTKKVKPGKHRFRVEAIDPAGNVDPTPATFSWKVLRP